MATNGRKTPTQEDFQELQDRCKALVEADQPEENLSTACLLRFLRAFQTVDVAHTALVKYIKWRKEFNVEGLTQDHPDIKFEASTGKAVILDHRDNSGRPIVYIATRKHNAYERDIDRLTRFIVFTLEQACEKCCEDIIDNLCILFDLKDFSMTNMDYQFVKNLIWLLSKYYPERLGTCLVINAPMIFYGCWAVIRPWLNDVTASKVTFVSNNQQLSDYLHPDILPKD